MTGSIGVCEISKFWVVNALINFDDIRVFICSMLTIYLSSDTFVIFG